ncbi:hypothetical protein ACVWXL_002799 [Bradyrhizobium sp. GM22.5]
MVAVGIGIGIGIGVGDGVGVGVGVGVGLCAKPDVVDSTMMRANATAAAIQRTRFSLIACRVSEGCEMQHMATNPEAKGGAQKSNRSGARVPRFVPNCY